MSLNFLGLGFSFGAKDMGLKKLQQQVTTGFEGINKEMGRLHETSQPAFDFVTDAMEGVDSVLARQEKRVGEWSQSFADSIDRVAGMPQQVTDAFQPLSDSLRRGAESVSRTWEGTFGKSFAAVGEGFDKLKMRMGGIVAATEPLTKKFRPVFKIGAEGAKLFGNAMQGILDKFRGLGDDVEESEGILKKFTFFFKKRGAEIGKTQQVIETGFDGIKTMVHKMNQLLRVNKLRGFMEAISVGTLSKISGALQNLGSAGMNLTTGLEAQGVALAKQSKATAVNLGLTGKELRKVSGQASGMALGLNIGAEQATQAIVGFKDAAGEMGLIGISSSADLAKLTEVTGLSAKDLALQLRTMRKTFGLADDDIKGLMSSFTSMGQVTRDVAGGIGTLPEVMQRMSKQAELMGRKLDPKQLANFAKQTAALSAGLYKITGSADQARQQSSELADAMLGAQKEFANMFAGTANDLPGFVKELAIMGGDVDAAFELIDRGPAGFVEGLKMMLQNAKKSGADMDQVMNFMRGRLEAAGITNTDTIMSFLRTTDDEVLDVMKSVHKSTASLGKLAKEGFSTGRTLQEAFDLARDSAIAHFRAGGKASKTFLKDFTKSATAFNKILDETSKKGGPLGKFVDQLRDVHRLGAAGLLPREMQGAGVLLGEIISQLGPLLGILGGAIVFFPGLTAVLGPLVTVLGLFSINLFKAKMAGQSWSEAFQTAFQDTLKIVKKAFTYFKQAIPKFIAAAKKILPGIIKAIAKEIPNVLAVSSEIQDAVIEAVIKYAPKIAKAFVKLVEKVVERFGKFAPKLIEAFTTLIDKLVEALPGIVPKLVEAFGKVLDAVIKGLVKIVPGLVGVIVEVVPTLIKGLADALPKVVGAIAKLAPTLIEGLVSILVSLAGELPNLLGKLIPAVIDGLQAIIEAIIKEAPKLFDAILDAVVGIAEKLPEMLPQLVKAIMKLLPKLIKGLAKMIASLANALPKILPPLLDAFVKGILLIVEMLPDIIPDLVKALITVIEALTKAAPKILPIVVKAFMALFMGLVKALPPILPALVSGIIDLLKATLPLLGKAVWEIAKQLWNMIFAVGDQNIITQLIDGLVDLVVGLAKGLQELIDKYIINPLADIWSLLEIPSLDDLWKDFKKGLEAVGKFFDKWFVEPFRVFFGWFEEIWDHLFGNSWVLDTFTDVSKGIQKIWDTIKGIIKEVFDFFKKIAKSVIRWVQKRFGKFFDYVEGMWTKFVEWVEKAIEGVKSAFRSMKEKLTEIFNGILDAAKKLWQDVVDSAKNIWNDMKAAWGDLKKFFSDIFAGIKDSVMAPVDAMVKYVKDAWDDGQGGGIRGWWEKAKTVFSDIFEAIARSVRAAFKKVTDWLKDALGPLKGLIETLDGLVDKVFRNSIHDDIDESMGLSAKYIQDNGKIMTDSWAATMKSIYDTGIKEFKNIEAATKTHTQNQLKTMEGFLGKLKGAFKKAFEEMDLSSQDLTANLRSAVDDVVEMVNEVTRAFRTLRRAQGAVEAAKAQAIEKAKEEAKELEIATAETLRIVSGDAGHIVNAVNQPDWWRKEARITFNQMVEVLQDVVQSTNSVKSSVDEVKTAVKQRPIGSTAARKAAATGNPPITGSSRSPRP